MIITVDKCSKLGISKLSTASIHYLPKLFINQVTIPTVDIGKSFKHLGRFFYFLMDNIDHVSEVLQLITDLMRKLMKFHVTRKTNSCCIIVLFFQSYHGTSQMQILVRHG